VSAFGTVGLSTGITPTLSPAGKMLLVLLMFAGRLGPLTVALAAGRQAARRVRFRYAEENVMVG
jgi:trk system potassium uptake protein TrkH